MKRFFSWLLAATLSSALAHTQVTVVSPTATLAVAAPKAVQLRFSEPVNLRFSTFRVVPLPAGQTADATAREALALGMDSPDLVHLGPKPTGMAAQLTLPLPPGLQAGRYLIAWAVLSEDGHPVRGHSVFRVK